ncbi:putative hydrolase [Microlunatus phosphovorus NM-1]|uniref:Putative hydrolase n=1 Tax=Microlunatus phosphovorus (strain ATCC 700054 / DSM 10555 / JCM 9379 / NBRC 101784 / NCIMB 13414 / VKM Ac-1990 / NM-1) TaxID=1032480 RepID=F5XG30_MICPN|nr:HAD family hydrolase [Microlunatus phosphovorus]BAK37964.1 putative hydrolase [Microlunatus phosphovorus NM-1]
MATVTANQRLVDVLAATRPVLLDFDGPVTHLFINGRNRMVADRMREAIPKDFQPPPDVWDTYDPLIVLRWTGSNTPRSVQEAVDAASVEGEVDAAHQTEPTPGSVEFLRACKQVGRPVVMVSNNAEQAIRAYLDRFDIADLVRAVIARTPGRPDLMKPHPDSINRALAVLDAEPSACCMVGDSVTDIRVCTTTGVHSIGFAKNPKRGQELAGAGAEALVDSMVSLANALITV